MDNEFKMAEYQTLRKEVGKAQGWEHFHARATGKRFRTDQSADVQRLNLCAAACGTFVFRCVNALSLVGTPLKVSGVVNLNHSSRKGSP